MASLQTIATSRTTRPLAPLRPARRCAVNRSIIVKANNSGFDVDKFVANLPVPVEYAYAGVAWVVAEEHCLNHNHGVRLEVTLAGVTILTWPTPLNFLGKSIILLHLLAAATSVARLGAIARPDQQTGESEALKAFGKGLLIGPFNVGWLGVNRFTK